MESMLRLLGNKVMLYRLNDILLYYLLDNNFSFHWVSKSVNIL